MKQLLAKGLLVLASFATFSTASAQFSDLIGTFRNTNYYVVLESDYASDPIDTVIRTMSGKVLAEVPSRFRAAMDIEGTGRLRDGRTVNYAGRINGEIRYWVVSSEWGLGVGSCPLIPFKSIAVDPKKIALGSIVQIDETIGMVLPDGSIHDGIWRAEDVGGAIKQDRVDLFIGLRRNSEYLVQQGIRNMKPLTIRLIAPPSPGSCVEHLMTFDDEQDSE
ncbi:MAG: hypothetical protein A2X94_07150 [Bdellovibrionales bacterium GWB1_55_8]|nr:MAG: hypothetical protein A2X94_07150 [Bdellovibrionales bacterium GWB1_55_8]